jgi:hypothetical protein
MSDISLIIFISTNNKSSNKLNMICETFDEYVETRCFSEFRRKYSFINSKNLILHQ